MNTLIPGAPLRSLSPTTNEYQRAQGESRAANPARAARFTLDAPEHSGTIARGERGHPDARRCVNVQPRCHLHAEPTHLNVRHRVVSPARIAERTASLEIRLKLVSVT